MKKIAVAVALFLLGSCAAATSAPEPAATDDALRAYYEFLIGEREATPVHDYYERYTLADDVDYPWISLDSAHLALIDINGDDLPELCLQTGSVNPRFHYKDGELYEVIPGYIYDTVLDNGVLYSHRYGRVDGHSYTVFGLDFSPISDVSCDRVYKDDINSEFVKFYFADGIDYTVEKGSVTKSEWEILTAPYFAEVEASGGQDFWYYNWITSDEWIIEYEKEHGIS
ncbi:MAG: hypothetical protein LBN99_02260 [Oscillospiraceae bacterium]|jgi:hypothetical protein|nr:hypothetical protein [Oscillospiraceae bacterium]